MASDQKVEWFQKRGEPDLQALLQREAEQETWRRYIMKITGLSEFAAADASPLEGRYSDKLFVGPCPDLTCPGRVYSIKCEKVCTTCRRRVDAEE